MAARLAQGRRREPAPWQLQQMARLPLLALLGVIAAAILVPLGLAATVGLPVVVGAVVFVLATSHSYGQVPEEKSLGEQAPLGLLLLFAAMLVCSVLANLPLPRPTGFEWLTARTLAEPLVLAAVGCAAGWVFGGLLPGSGWQRAGRPWRKGD
jgi:hypothetical protein